MDGSVLFFISSGIFLGWSLGANHAVNVFGTAVMSKMVRYRVAATVAGIFVVLGAVFGGAGATRTITELGAVNALAGSFTVALAVGVTVSWMTYLKLPVSTSQAIIGGIVGWNLFTGSPTDTGAMVKIVGSWVTSPVLAGVIAFVLFKEVSWFIRRARIHLLELDSYTRIGLLAVGALASYTLGANNIANVMGLFVAAAPFKDLAIGDGLVFSGTQQLFLIGGVAIAIGIFTYGQKVMVTVGAELYRITPLSGFVVVLAESIVLYMFSSESLEALLRSLHLPTIPLVPVASTQAVIGAVVGVGLAREGRAINLRVLGKIVVGWVIAPLAALLLTFVLLFFVQNVFERQVIGDSKFHVSPAVVEAAEARGIAAEPMRSLIGRSYASANQLRSMCEGLGDYSRTDVDIVLRLARIDSLEVDSVKAGEVLDPELLPREQWRGIAAMHGEVFLHRCDFEHALRFRTVRLDTVDVPLFDGITQIQLDALAGAFRIRPASQPR